MKASLKFREEQKPLFRAKVPLSILGLPFQSGIAAGESKELSLSLSTLFDAGPSLKFAYRPNDSWNPFNLVLRTGIGPFGSPNSASMTMSAEFNLLEPGNPKFFLHFKPQFGDFSIRKSQSSVFNLKVGSQKGVVSEDEGSVEVVERPAVNGGFLSEDGPFNSLKKLTVLPSQSPAAGVIGGLFAGTKVNATTVLPVRSGGILKCRWGVKFPSELGRAFADGASKSRTAGVSLKSVPLLVLNKIGVEHVANGNSKECTNVAPSLNHPENANEAEARFAVKRQVEILQAENGLLKKAMDSLRSDIEALRPASVVGAAGSGVKIDQRKTNDKKSSENSGKGANVDVNEELKKALMGGSGA